MRRPYSLRKLDIATYGTPAHNGAMIRFPRLLSALAMLIAASPALAQKMSPADQVAVQLALSRGQLLFAFDQAAWHATDALRADAKTQGRLDALVSQLGGWIVRQIDPKTLEVSFFDKSSEDPKLLYAARLSDSGTKLLSHGFLAEGAKVPDALTLRMISARRSALNAIAGQSLLRCASGPYNFTVLPPEMPDGPIPVYILTPQSDLTHVPFGGHSRLMVTADGKAGPIHAFTKTCMEVPNHSSKDAPAALVATQLLDPIPTEIAVFTMFAAGLPLYIGTPDGRLWSLRASDGVATIRLLLANGKKR
jgi:hypothetical protein